MDKLITIVGIVALLVIFVLPFLPFGTRPRCPECGSRKIGVNKTTTGFRSSDYGGEGGSHSAIQMQYDVKYCCNDCQAQWQKSETETG